jgi:hypothetical protein
MTGFTRCIENKSRSYEPRFPLKPKVPSPHRKRNPRCIFSTAASFDAKALGVVGRGSGRPYRFAEGRGGTGVVIPDRGGEVEDGHLELLLLPEPLPKRLEARLYRRLVRRRHVRSRFRDEIW